MQKRKLKVGSPEFNEHRIEVTKKRHGVNAFKNYGKLGGDAILMDKKIMKAYKEDKLKIIK